LADPIEVKRRLAAIFAADVEGYSRLMGADEVATLNALTARREILDGLIATHGGRIANTAGDSVLAEFGSAVDAVRCAMETQVALAKANSTLPENRQINFRIGVHVGDVMVRAGDLFGDGVNIAARLQSIAKPGGVCISGATYDQVRKVLPMTFVDLGAQQVKNIQEPIKAYQVGATSDTGEAALARVAEAESPPPLPDKPSIAVLPFQNMSGDPEQEYFADGVMEDIITALSRFKSLFVIARNSTFTYKGRAVDVKQVGRELGVRYILEGSVRRFAQKVRVTGQLVQAATGSPLWADKIDGPVNDIFDLQDKVTAAVVAAIDPTVQRAEIERAWRKPTQSLDAYDCYLRGMRNLRQFALETNIEAERLFRRAIDLDANFAAAYGQVAGCYRTRLLFAWTGVDKRAALEGRPFALRAIELGQDDAVALACAALFLAYVSKEFPLAVAVIDQAVRINPNLFEARQVRGLMNTWLGHHDLAIEQANADIRLNPRDPDMAWTDATLAWSSLFLGRTDDAISSATRWVARRPNVTAAIRACIVAYALAGQMDEARRFYLRLRQLDPDGTLSKLRATLPFQRPEDASLFLTTLRQAGMPE
jgi:TolB-like protein/class 3 adenylate cyclase